MTSRRLSKGFSILQDVPGNDDEAEREHLRAQREKRRLSHTPKARRRLSGVAVNAEPDKNVLEIYDRCIKLSAENKINRQNTWDLSLIDHIDDVIGNTGANTNFQKASCTLDASVKIYSYRVDSVHHDMFKVLGGLNRTDPNGSEEEDQQEVNDEENEVGKAPSVNVNRPRQRNRQHQLNCHLELRPAALLVPLSELLFEVDPMFQRTASSFDEGGAKGLLVNQLNVGQRCHIVFDFSADMDTETTDRHRNNIPIEIPQSFLSLWPTVYNSDSHISPLTSTLRAALHDDEDRSNVEVDIHDYRPDTSLQEPQPDEEQIPPENYDIDDSRDEDDGDFPFNTEDHEMDSFNQHEPSPVPDDNQEPFNENSELNLGEDTDRDNPVEETSTDAAIFSPSFSRRATALFNEASGLNLPHLLLNKNWAGPGIGTSHWRFKGEPQHHGSNQEREVEVLNSRLKKTKISYEINFRGGVVSESDLSDPFRASNVLSKASYTKSSSLNHLLPTDLHISQTVLFRLFHRPNFFLRPGKNAFADGNAETVNCLGPNDDQIQPNLCAFDDGFEDDDDGFAPNICNDNDNNGGLYASEFNFIAQPATAEKIELDFAKSVKKVDIKAVKQCLWSTLSEKTESAPPLVVDDNNDCSIADDENGGTQPDSQSEWPSFKEMIRSVPVPESSREAMSVQLYFICLLHLANENDLVLKPGTTFLGDFSIGRRARLSN